MNLTRIRPKMDILDQMTDNFYAFTNQKEDFAKYSDVLLHFQKYKSLGKSPVYVTNGRRLYALRDNYHLTGNFHPCLPYFPLLNQKLVLSVYPIIHRLIDMGYYTLYKHHNKLFKQRVASILTTLRAERVDFIDGQPRFGKSSQVFNRNQRTLFVRFARNDVVHPFFEPFAARKVTPEMFSWVNKKAKRHQSSSSCSLVEEDTDSEEVGFDFVERKTKNSSSSSSEGFAESIKNMFSSVSQNVANAQKDTVSKTIIGAVDSLALDDIFIDKCAELMNRIASRAVTRGVESFFNAVKSLPQILYKLILAAKERIEKFISLPKLALVFAGTIAALLLIVTFAYFGLFQKIKDFLFQHTENEEVVAESATTAFAALSAFAMSIIGASINDGRALSDVIRNFSSVFATVQRMDVAANLRYIIDWLSVKIVGSPYSEVGKVLKEISQVDDIVDKYDKLGPGLMQWYYADLAHKQQFEDDFRLIGTLRVKAVKMREVDNRVYMSFMNRYQIMEEFERKIRNSVYAAKNRPKPVVILFSGPPGEGKTYHLSRFCAALKARFEPNGSFSKSDIYSYDSTDEYWSGYRGQPFVTVDEAWNATKEDNNIKFSNVFQKMTGNGLCKLTMPGLMDKDNTYFSSKFILLTTNQYYPQTGNKPRTIDRSGLLTPESLSRRFTIPLRVYRGKDEPRQEGETLQEWCDRTTVYEFIPPADPKWDGPAHIKAHTKMSFTDVVSLAERVYRRTNAVLDSQEAEFEEFFQTQRMVQGQFKQVEPVLSEYVATYNADLDNYTYFMHNNPGRTNFIQGFDAMTCIGNVVDFGSLMYIISRYFNTNGIMMAHPAGALNYRYVELEATDAMMLNRLFNQLGGCPLPILYMLDWQEAHMRKAMLDVVTDDSMAVSAFYGDYPRVSRMKQQVYFTAYRAYCATKKAASSFCQNAVTDLAAFYDSMSQKLEAFFTRNSTLIFSLGLGLLSALVYAITYYMSYRMQVWMLNPGRNRAKLDKYINYLKAKPASSMLLTYAEFKDGNVDDASVTEVYCQKCREKGIAFAVYKAWRNDAIRADVTKGQLNRKYGIAEFQTVSGQSLVFKNKDVPTTVDNAKVVETGLLSRVRGEGEPSVPVQLQHAMQRMTVIRDNVTYTVPCVFLDTQTIQTQRHSWQGADSISLTTYSKTGDIQANIVLAREDFRIVEMPERDTIMILVPKGVHGFPSLKRKFLLSKKELKAMPKTAKIISIQRTERGIVYRYPQYADGRTADFTVKCVDGSVILASEYIRFPGFEGESGFCGSLYLALIAGSWKLVGVHFATNRMQRFAMASPIYDTDSGGEGFEVVGEWFKDILPTSSPCGTKPYAVLKRKVVASTNNTVVPSLLYQKAEQHDIKLPKVEAMPAHLGDQHESEFYHDINSSPITPSFYTEVNNGDWDFLFKGYELPRLPEVPRRPLTIEEACHGEPAIGCDSLDTSTSVGPEKYLGAVKPWLDHETRYLDPIIKHRAEVINELESKGGISMIVSIDSQKPEPRDLTIEVSDESKTTSKRCVYEEFKDGKYHSTMIKPARLFHNVAKSDVITSKQSLWSAFKVMLLMWQTMYCAVGMNFHDPVQIRALLDRMKVHRNHMTFDHSKYDFHLPPWLSILFFHYLQCYYRYPKDSSAYNRLRAQCLKITHVLHLKGSISYVSQRGLPSGAWPTLFFNTFANLVLFNLVFRYLLSKTNAKLVLSEHVQYCFFGDDAWISVSDTIKKHLNPKAISEAFKLLYDMKLTPADKGNCFEYKRLTDVEFLHRNFSVVRSIPRFPLAKASLWKMLQFDRRTYDRIELTAEKLTMFYCELSHYPREFYDEWTPRILEAASYAGVKFTPPAYEDLIANAIAYYD